MTPFAEWPKESPEAMDVTIISSKVQPYTLFRPTLSPSHPKKSCPHSVPHNATPLTAADTLGGSTPGLAEFGSK